MRNDVVSNLVAQVQRLGEWGFIEVVRALGEKYPGGLLKLTQDVGRDWRRATIVDARIVTFLIDSTINQWVRLHLRCETGADVIDSVRSDVGASEEQAARYGSFLRALPEHTRMVWGSTVGLKVQYKIERVSTGLDRYFASIIYRPVEDMTNGS